MKPKTKLEKRVFELHKTLSPLTEDHKTYGREETFNKSYVISRNRHFCLECGHKWDAGLRHDWQYKVADPNPTCPSCQQKLTNIQANRKRYHGNCILYVLDRCEEFQVIRYLSIDKHMEKQKAAEFYYTEVMQRWLSPQGKETIVSRNVISSMSYYVEPRFDNLSELEITRSKSNFRNTIYPDAIYPKRKIIKELKRNGFKTGFHRIRPDTLFKELLTNSKVETLFKAKQYKLMRAAITSPTYVNKYWDSIKICIRNNYIVKGSSDWFDMLSNLQYLGKDMRSPHYICPKDMHKAHNKWLTKAQDKRKKERMRKMLEDLRKDQIDYDKYRGLYFGLVFKQGDLVVSVCDSVRKLYEESEALKHCAYFNGYHKRRKSLMLSATWKGDVVETVEFDLETFTVVQARGFKNQASKYNKQIVQLVNSHAKEIKKLHTKSLKQQRKKAA